MNRLNGIQRLSAESLDIYEELEIFRTGLASIRFVSIRDGGADEREAWLLEAFPDYRAFEYIENETSSISTREGDFNILVFGGNDVARMRRFLKQNHGLLINRVKICLMRGSDARRRASALMAGFDDVFDTMKSQPLEGLARAHSIWRRYQLSLSHVDQAQQLEAQLRDYCDVHRVTPRQRRCLEALLEAKGRIVGYRQLSERIGRGEAYISDANLKVIVCHLRKQLRPGCSIKAEHGLGYRLIASARFLPSASRSVVA